jgi:hypothetical protein
MPGWHRRCVSTITLWGLCGRVMPENCTFVLPKINMLRVRALGFGRLDYNKGALGTLGDFDG